MPAITTSSLAYCVESVAGTYFLSRFHFLLVSAIPNKTVSEQALNGYVMK
jgi:hypothetical protein